jgi:hypothetical protein
MRPLRFRRQWPRHAPIAAARCIGSSLAADRCLREQARQLRVFRDDFGLALFRLEVLAFFVACFVALRVALFADFAAAFRFDVDFDFFAVAFAGARFFCGRCLCLCVPCGRLTLNTSLTSGHYGARTQHQSMYRSPACQPRFQLPHLQRHPQGCS